MHNTPGILAAGAALMVANAAAPAQNYPAKSVRLVVPYTAGGSMDILSRLLSQKITGVNAAQTGTTIRIFVGNYPEPIAIDGSIKRPILERWEPAPPNGVVTIGP